ncbi:hypothetical protein [Lysinibacillus fusiformis]|uniref:hypothetical protein n=1 Tax=Lysinibacillus fusiformis TaxID=28031 RepID=UPI0020BED5AC|nr:hypothetical protein [Lysinibacillus fusiformis]
MAKTKGITIRLEFDDKSKLKLRAIAKHVGALADELDAIDNAWQCDCGSIEYIDTTLEAFKESRCTVRECNQCHERYAIPTDDELPTRLEGTD